MTDTNIPKEAYKATFKEIFQKSLRLNARSMSVKTILSERNLKRIDYSPYYQRNYVWDSHKQSFFIESVILGTEIPPLILFKSGNKIEVIDGRQRFETLKKFKENSITLRVKGLMELQVLKNKSFNKLSTEIQHIFLDSNIRVFEFEVINQPDISQGTLDKVKKEIFRRYNTGITPLNREELDNAKYDEDSFSEQFKSKLNTDYSFLKDFNKCFFPKQVIQEKGRNDGLIAKNVDFIRKYRILNTFPISKYAGGSRTETFDLLYDFAKTSTSDDESFSNFLNILNDVIQLSDYLLNEKELVNKLVYECILWAFTIIAKENASFNIEENKEKILGHYHDNLPKYSSDNPHYYSSIITRFSDTAYLFQKITKLNFSEYIRDESFRDTINTLKQTEVDAAKSIEELSNLRLNKPNPISTPIDEIKLDLKTNRYLLRPSYQRQEKINIVKASSLIESILLGINIPPIFLYKKNNNVKEVVDGQQRLLAIIGFLGEQFYNEDGELKFSKNNNFKLKGLKILTEFENYNYSRLPESYKDKILDFVIDMIVIEQSVNDKFDPVDLFIRLNYKPYPIKANSFEMWNSIVDHEVTKAIKEICKVESISSWFFLRETAEGKPDRMLNEELITILSYLCYVYSNDININDIIGFFPRQDRITCRLMNKSALTDFLVNEIDSNQISKMDFLDSINKTKMLIIEVGNLFEESPSKETLNEVLNVKKSKTFRRSLQDFYVIWMFIANVPFNKLKNNAKIFEDIIGLLSHLRNVDDVPVDSDYVDSFKSKLDFLVEGYK